jgi:hypothetical protein
MELKIDSEFRDLIPPLSPEELGNLEQSLLSEGCRDAILTWNDFIIDGHNRYGLCTKLGIPFRTEARQFESRNDVCIWMIQNQFARRNLDNWVKGSLSLRLEDYFREKALENKSNAAVLSNTLRGAANNSEFPKSGTPEIKKFEKINTERELSKIAGVSHDTIYKVKEIKSQTPIEILPDLESKIISHSVSINQAHKFVRAINAFKSTLIDVVTVARKILMEFDKNPSVSLENKTKDVIKEIQKEERAQAVKAALEQERIAREKAKAEREERERIEAERLRKEREEREKAEKERLEKERIAREQARKEREEQERIKKEQWEKEKAENERIRKEKAEKARLEQERLAKERAERARIERESLEKERQELERQRKERLEKERLEKERIEKEKAEQKRLADAEAERKRQERLKLEAEERERKRIENEKREQGLIPSYIHEISIFWRFSVAKIIKAFFVFLIA